MTSSNSVVGIRSRKLQRKQRRLDRKQARMRYVNNKYGRIAEAQLQQVSTIMKRQKRCADHSAQISDQQCTKKKHRSEEDSEQPADRVDADEAEIKRLEKLLKIKKSNSRKVGNSSWKDDLDSLLGEFSDEDESLSASCADEVSLDSGGRISDDHYFDNGEEKDSVHSDEDYGLEPDSDLPSDNEDVTTKTGRTTDIYGRPLNSDDATVPKYVPPAIRQSESRSARIKAVEAGLKGQLNRLTADTLDGVSRQVESMYQNHPRADVSESLINLISAAVVTCSSNIVRPAERMVIEYVSLLAVIHLTVGVEVGAFIVQHFVHHFITILDDLSDVQKPDECSRAIENAVQFVVHFYTFKIVNSQLIFDICDRIVQLMLNHSATTDHVMTKSVELLLIILRSVGFYLRRDSPGKLRDLITNVQGSEKIMKSSADARTKFMLEVLMAIKNNNVNKIPNYDVAHQEMLVKRVRIVARQHVRSNSLSFQPFSVRLDDLLNADSRGRWWIVGSAWNPDAAGDVDKQSAGSVTDNSTSISDDLLVLAKQMRMNTDARRLIFCQLMSSDDSADAVRRLLKVGPITHVHRETVFVIVHCLLQEKTFNPFYVQTLLQLSRVSRKYVLATHFTIWDRLKTIADLKARSQVSLVRLVDFAVVNRIITLDKALRVIDFVDMNTTCAEFLGHLLVGLLISNDVPTVKTIFASFQQRSKRFAMATDQIANHRLARESVRLFLRHFLAGGNVAAVKVLDGDKRAMLDERIQVADSAMFARDALV